MKRHHVFQPVVGEAPRVLVLGTFPGLKSREDQMYYAHPRNQFWPIVFQICGVPYQQPDNCEKLQLLRQYGIALWDMVESCETDGSLDTEIQNPRLIDLQGFLMQYSTISLVCFNGGNAARFGKRAGKLPVASVTLPSTSPANARYSPGQKLEAWRDALEPVLFPERACGKEQL